MIGETAIAGVITGLIQTHKMDKWGKLIISTCFSGLITFMVSWGSGGLAHMLSGTPWPVSIALGFCEGLTASAAIMWFRLTGDELAKGIRFSAPGIIIQYLRNVLMKQSVVTQGGGKE